MSNREVNQIDKKTMNDQRIYWAINLDDDLCSYRTAYKALIGNSPYRMLFGKTYHLPAEMEHKAY